ncbi:unnamed protein product [Adineta ricciae]|uniref:Uncharacterized protein n=1 Tax=Adineta ricciae TaxID=249248 RepID=A0A815JZQ1_ADIRI|nr:unnamed protein product [Adineta ricciae]
MALAVNPPTTLTFYGPFNVVSTATLTLSNNGTDRLAFKLKTTTPRRFCVRPNNGFLEPNTNVVVQILLQPSRPGGPVDEFNRYKFLLLWTVVPDNEQADIESFTQTDSDREDLTSTSEQNCLGPERIVGDSSVSELECPICHNILWKPVACNTCENAFCAYCIHKWINQRDSKSEKICPFACTFEEKRAPPVLNKLLTKLQIYCAYRDNGCQQILNYDALETHQKTCEYKSIICSVCHIIITNQNLTDNSHNIRQCFTNVQKAQTDSQVQIHMMMLLDVIDRQNTRIKALESQTNDIPS